MAGEGWAGMATDGVLTRSLRDTATFLDATVGPDLGVPYYAPAMKGTFAEAMARPPEPLRIRFTTATLSGEAIHPECRAAVEAAARLAADLGHHVEEITFGDELGVEAVMQAWTKVVACGTALTVSKKLAGAPLDGALVEGITRGAIRLADTVSGADYLASVNEIHAFGRRMARIFLDCDVLISATLAEPPAKVGRLKPDNEDFMDYRTGPEGVFAYSPFTAAFNASGQPCVSLPLHWSADDLPVGVHLAAAFGEDETVMALSAQLETAAPWAPKQQSLISGGGVRT